MKTRLLLTASAAVLAASITGTTATAGTTATWTVRPGGAITAKFSRMILTDTRTGAPVECPATLKATLASGTGLSGTGIGSVSSFTFGTCTGPADFKFTLKPSHLPYPLNAASYNATAGTMTGSIAGFHGAFSGSGCLFVLDGTGPGKDNGTLALTYVNGTQRLNFLKTGGNLHVYKLNGCGAFVTNNKDPLTLSGTGTATPAQSITSP